VPLLHNLTEPQLWRLARAMLTAEFAKGDLVFKKARRGALPLSSLPLLFGFQRVCRSFG